MYSLQRQGRPRHRRAARHRLRDRAGAASPAARRSCSPTSTRTRPRRPPPRWAARRSAWAPTSPTARAWPPSSPRSSSSFGALDVVVANAGIAPDAGTVARDGRGGLRARHRGRPARRLPDGRAGAAARDRQRGGHVVVVASVYAFTNGVGNAPYAMAKAGVEQFGRALRAELSIARRERDHRVLRLHRHGDGPRGASTAARSREQMLEPGPELPAQAAAAERGGRGHRRARSRSARRAAHPAEALGGAVGAARRRQPAHRRADGARSRTTSRQLRAQARPCLTSCARSSTASSSRSSSPTGCASRGCSCRPARTSRRRTTASCSPSGPGLDWWESRRGRDAGRPRRPRRLPGAAGAWVDVEEERLLVCRVDGAARRARASSPGLTCRRLRRGGSRSPRRASTAARGSRRRARCGRPSSGSGCCRSTPSTCSSARTTCRCSRGSGPYDRTALDRLAHRTRRGGCSSTGGTRRR